MPHANGPSRLRLSAFLLGLALAAPAAARELRWSALDVRARLDASGALHVIERHAMVFSGDWNGGERVFRVFPGQTLRLEELRRIGPEDEAHALAPGDLSAVDEFAWKDPVTLRWRSRLPSDPPFDDTELVYEIAYTLSGVLAKQGGRYVLDHDFAFPDRIGPIEKFTLALDLDPAWKPETAFSRSLSRGPLRPGEGHVVRLSLSYAGAGAPVAGRSVASRTARMACVLVLTAGIAFLYFSFRSRERALGRLTPLVAPESIDEGWLSTNLFPLSPEEAGALWDEKVGPPEVAAVLARLSSEKKIETHAEDKKLTMRLRVSLDRLEGYDHELAKALFFGGRTETDTETIRTHYRSSGFDPVSKIREGLEARLKTHPDFQDKSSPPSRWPTAILLTAGALALVLSVLTVGESPGTVIGIGIMHLVLYGAGAVCAVFFQRRVDRVDAFSPVFLWVPALFLYFAWEGARRGGQSSVLLVAGVLLLRLGIANSLFNLVKTRNGPKRIARRKALASARAFFAEELRRPAPRLKDEWFPYVVAFGLTSDADRWFRAHGRSVPVAGSGSSSGSTSSPSSSSGAWSGGGGAFGGAGASGSWAVAAGALAAGVSAPSSSGGGGGGGGGGGSSGGGGGGGW